MTQDLAPNPDLRPQFSRELPWLQVAWDSTSMAAFKECPRKYYYKMIQNWRSKREAVALTFGIMFHSAMETYFRVKAEGNDHRTSTRAAVRRALELSGAYETVGAGVANSNNPNPPKIWRPWDSDDNARNRVTLIRSVVWYLEQFEHDALETVILANGKPAVELSFRVAIPFEAPGGEPFLYCGHLDRLVLFGSDHYVADYKSTKSSLGPDFFDRYSPDNQMSGYTFGGRVVYQVPVKGVIIDGVQLLVSGTRFQRGFCHRTPAQVDEWLRDIGLKLEEARRCAEQQYWPMNDQACNKFGGCEFRGVCNKDPQVRHLYLDSGFEKVEWNPLTPRGGD